jgi:hypothetical protein
MQPSSLESGSVGNVAAPKPPQAHCQDPLYYFQDQLGRTPYRAGAMRLVEVVVVAEAAVVQMS